MLLLYLINKQLLVTNQFTVYFSFQVDSRKTLYLTTIWRKRIAQTFPCQSSDVAWILLGRTAHKGGKSRHHRRELAMMRNVLPERLPPSFYTAVIFSIPFHCVLLDNQLFTFQAYNNLNIPKLYSLYWIIVL